MQANLVRAEARLVVASGELQKAQAQLDEKNRELKVVQDLYDSAMKEKQVSLSVEFKLENLSSESLFCLFFQVMNFNNVLTLKTP